jgi:tetratricopeptide (TPR) repeat protein
MIIRIKDSREQTGRANKLFLLIALFIFIGLAAGTFFLLKGGRSSSKTLSLDKRPSNNKLFFDFAGILSNEDEYVENYLASIRDRYRIESVIVTLPSLRNFGTIHDAALKLMSDWKIGGNFGNRGVLVLLAETEKEAKVEISYELEDVFTDSFTGYAEDLQLKPYLRMGHVGSGLVAVIEEIEIRAELKNQQHYTPKMIENLDAQFASGGAGAARKLKSVPLPDQGTRAKAIASILAPGSSVITDSELLKTGAGKDLRFPAGKTPQEAYDIWRAAYQASDDTRAVKESKLLEGKPYEVLQDEKRAVIFFGNPKDWDNPPLLFAKTSDGWKFDYVNQGLYVRYGAAYNWGIERGDHDYVDLLYKCPYSWGTDIPWEEQDIYQVERDSEIVAGILKLEEQYRKNQDDFDTSLELGRLGVITARRVDLTLRPLAKAKKLKPKDPLPYKYSAIAYAISIQYKKAILEIKEMLKRDPRSLFGLRFLGYMYYQTKDLDSAIRNLQAAWQMDRSDCYTATTLARAYGDRFKDRGSQNDKKAALELLGKSSEEICSPSKRRVQWLEAELINRDILAPVLFGASIYWYNYQAEQGVLVYDIQAGKPADLAGLEEGDFIMSFEGKPVYQPWPLFYLISICQPGQRVKVEIIRGALNGPLSLGDNIKVNPKTYGLSQPKRMTIIVTLGRKY